MAKNHIQQGKALTYSNPGEALIAAGSVVVAGAIIGIALDDIPGGKDGTIQTEEVFRLPKDAATPFSLGDRAYWHTEQKKIVAAPGNGIVLAGIAAANVSASATTVAIKINAAPGA